jgi:hypothetical protein
LETSLLRIRDWAVVENFYEHWAQSAALDFLAAVRDESALI